MKLKTEIVNEKQKALIISKINYSFIDILKSHFDKYSVEAFFSSIEPKSFRFFNYVFIIDNLLTVEKIKKYSQIKYIFIFINKNPSNFILKNKNQNIKIIKLNHSYLTAIEIDRILWFVFSQSTEKFLKIDNLAQEKKIIKTNFLKINFFNKNFLIRLLIWLVFIWHTLFIPFILLSYFYIYLSFKQFKKENFQKTTNYILKAKSFFNTSKSLYQLANQTYKLFGISSFPENIINVNELTINSFNEAISIVENTKKIQQLIFTKNKSQAEINDLKLRLKNLDYSLDNIKNNLNDINEKLDFSIDAIKKIKQNLIETQDLLSKSTSFYKYFENILIQNKNSKYVIFFANNMELRPGGGFLGSFAIIEIGNFQVSELKIYDIYDADGQLTAHLDPPKPLEKYLNLPHWFLRDSNFSPDFTVNYQKALFFLEKEMKFTDFDGGILLTTTTIENILSAFNNIYLPDYKEYINSKNFYLKTQLYVEKNFFPGSIQKQTFLSKLVNQIIINLDQASLIKLFLSIKKSLDEKQMVLYFNDENMQKLVDSFFWSGRVIEPKCLINSQNCIVDYLFPYDANVGANKANFFINKFFYLKTTVNSSNTISHLLTIKYENTSPSEIFPTGYFRNYFQILLPKDVLVKSITKNGVLVEDFDENNDIFKSIGFYFEIPPKQSIEIRINYQLNQTLVDNNQIYQLVFQKQIGEKNNDLILDFSFDKNLSLINQNFSPLVKNNQIIYNTSLTTDKIFLIEIKTNKL
ncbi:MAG: hypothetical protein Fur009_2220 [Candidatus Microgenomates bacterium]